MSEAPAGAWHPHRSTPLYDQLEFGTFGGAEVYCTTTTLQTITSCNFVAIILRLSEEELEHHLEDPGMWEELASDQHAVQIMETTGVYG